MIKLKKLFQPVRKKIMVTYDKFLDHPKTGKILRRTQYALCIAIAVVYVPWLMYPRMFVLYIIIGVLENLVAINIILILMVSIRILRNVTKDQRDVIERSDYALAQCNRLIIVLVQEKNELRRQVAEYQQRLYDMDIKDDQKN